MKKGAIALSVNAIVILILAIVMLGLGVTFIRTMFSQAAGQIEEMISAEPEPQQPFRSQPVTISREHIITVAGSTEIIKVSVFNAWGGTTTTGPTGPTTTVYNCGAVFDCAAPPCGVGGGDYYITDGGLDDNTCNDINDASGANVCVWNFGTMTCNDATGGASVCTDISTSGNTVSSHGAPFDAAGRANDDNYAKCEALGCGASSGGLCTDLGGSGPTATGNSTNPAIVCVNNNTIASIQSQSKLIPAGDSATFNVVLEIGNVGEGTQLCRIEIGNVIPPLSKDFVIDIRRN